MERQNPELKILPTFKILAFSNPEETILADFKILAIQIPEFKILNDFKILAFQNPDLKILADFQILAFQNTEFKISADLKILAPYTRISKVQVLNDQGLFWCWAYMDQGVCTAWQMALLSDAPLLYNQFPVIKRD